MAKARTQKRKRSYNTRLIKEDYSYFVEEVADLFSVDVATVRRWMREDGLKRLPETRPHLIHSTDLKAFHEKRQAERERPCDPNQVYCFRCQLPRTPQIGSGTCTEQPNKSVRFKAKCSECGCILHRCVSAVEWNENHPLAEFLSGAAKEHNGGHPTHRECSLQQESNA